MNYVILFIIIIMLDTFNEEEEHVEEMYRVKRKFSWIDLINILYLTPIITKKIFFFLLKDVKG